jgi:type III secretion protein Q
MTVHFNTAPKSALRAASASDGQLRSTLMAGEGLRLPAISPVQVDPLNAFYRRRPALAFRVAGRAATIRASWPLAPPDAGRCRLDLTVGGAPGAVILPGALIEAAIAALDPNQGLDRLEPPHVALVLELALTEELSMFEASLGVRVAITSVRAEDGDRQNRAAALAVDITVEGLGRFGGELLLQPAHAIMFAQLLDRCAPRSNPARQAGEGNSIYPPSLRGQDSPGAAIELPVAVCARVAAATLAVGEIATLSPGDVVMADHSRQRSGTAVAVIAEHLVAPVELTAAGAQIAARPTRAHGSLWEWSMENGGDRAPADLRKETDVDDIPVKLLFELGRIELSFAEIRQLAPGALIPMLRPLEDSVDILANGRRIGRGNLVQIGDCMGVRITRLFDNV